MSELVRIVLDHHPIQSAPEEVSIWRNRTFRTVFASYSLSLLGNTFHSIALNLWVLQTTGSAKLMSLVLITHLVVSMLFGSIAGTVADRVNRRRLMVATDLFRFIIVGGIALCMALPDIPFFLILLLTAIVALAGAFRGPAFQASLIEVVGKRGVAQAVAAISVSDNLIRIAGFAAGGTAVAMFGGVFAVAIDASTFLLSGMLLLFAGRFPYAAPERQDREKTSFRTDFIEGFRVVWHNRFIRGVVALLPLVMFFFLSTFMLIQVMAVQVWQASPFVFGLLEACIPLGYVLGSIIIMKFDKRIRHRGKLALISITLMGPLFVAISWLPTAAAALPLIGLVGVLFSFSTTILFILLRVAIDPSLQGRVFGLLGTLTSIAPPVGLAVFSALSDSFGPAIIMMYSGAAMLVAGIAAYMGLRSMREYS
ncbi:MFS transporter [Paenibacillus paeoniae]|uniref:MFS transporter n=1 Tax=Paenibacillus paeoniae TaxID=2292705 RepID=A0A371PHB0_9BACL|nr:MFS transporter [Paenibacillus paeoniae]REK74918.1 MFS transporter [Paenibacillus paeoniae]